MPLLGMYARRKKIRYFLDPIPKSDKILEIGCGSMWVAEYLRGNGWAIPADRTPATSCHPQRSKGYGPGIGIPSIREPSRRPCNSLHTRSFKRAHRYRHTTQIVKISVYVGLSYETATTFLTSGSFSLRIRSIPSFMVIAAPGQP